MANLLPYLGTRKLESFGAGLGQGIHEAANRRLSQLNERDRRSELSKLLQATNKYSPEESNLIAALGDKNFLQAAEMFQGGKKKSKELIAQVNGPSQSESLINRLNELKQNRPQEISQQDLLKSLQQNNLSGLQPTPEASYDISKITPQQLIEQASAMGRALSPQEIDKVTNKLQAIQADKGQLDQLQKDINEHIQGQMAQQPQSLTQRLKEPKTEQSFYRKPITESQRLAREKFELAQKEKEQEKSKVKETSESRKFYQTVENEGKAAKNADIRLDRMETLIKKGNLPSSTWHRTFKALSEVGGEGGIPIVGPLIGILANPIGGAGLSVQRAISSDVEEFEKLSADFIKDAKNYFPGRVTNTELESFLRTIPTLSQSDQGKAAIIENMRSFNKIAQLRSKAARDIVKINGGKKPEDLDILVDETIAPQLDKMSEEFRTRINKKIVYEPRERWLGGLLPKLPSATGF